MENSKVFYFSILIVFGSTFSVYAQDYCVDYSCKFDKLKNKIEIIRERCGDVCDRKFVNRDDVQNVKENGPYYPYLEKNIDCRNLFSTPEMDQETLFKFPVKKIPKFLIQDYIFDESIELKYQFFADPNGATHTPVWTEDYVEELRSQLREGKLSGSYGIESVQRIYAHVKTFMNVTENSHLLVIGSQAPWLEAILLEAGVARITTLEYMPIKSEHPSISTILPEEMAKLYLSGELPVFDGVVSFSSIEHSGLGRYSDGLNPWGDVIVMARAWCVTKPGGRALIGVPTNPKDKVIFNGAKIYGPLQYAQLFSNWKQVFTSAFDTMVDEVPEWVYQPIHIVEKVDNKMNLP